MYYFNGDYANTYYFGMVTDLASAAKIKVSMAPGATWADIPFVAGEDTHYQLCGLCGAHVNEETHNGGTATCLKLAKCEDCGAEYGTKADHVYGTTLSSKDADTHGFKCTTEGCSSFKEDSVAPHEFVSGTCECGATQNTGGTLTSEKTLDFSTTSQRTVSTTSQQIWTDGTISLVYDKANYNNNLAEYNNPLRLYKGTTFTISSTGGSFNTIVINSANYADRIAALTETLEASGLTYTANGTVFTITFAEAVDTTAAISLANQCRIVSIVVSYVE